MLAFIRQYEEYRRECHISDTTPTKSTLKSMNISPTFLNVLRLSFEVGYRLEKATISKKIKKIEKIIDRMDELFNEVNNVSTNPEFDDIVALAAAYYNIGLECIKNNIKKNEILLIDAKLCLFRSTRLLRVKPVDPKAILTHIAALNELDTVYQDMETKDKQSLTFLPKAQYLYFTYISEKYPEPIHIASVIGIKEEESNPSIILDTLFCRTLQDSVIHYLAKPKDNYYFVLCIHILLSTQLKNLISEGKCDEQFEEIDIALTLFDLSKYFLANDRFTEAKQYINAADYVISKCLQNNQLQLNRFDENYDNIRATSRSFWGSYGVHLLRFWLNKYLQNKENTSSEIQELMSEAEIKDEEDSPSFIFSNLEKELEYMTHQFKETCILKPVDAKTVFVKTLENLNFAKEYFSVVNDIESYVRIGLEISNAYKYFVGFEEQRNEQIDLHKGRVDCLENVCKKVEKCTTIVDKELHMRIFYEIVISCCTVMDLMFEETYNDISYKEVIIKIDRYAKLIEKYITFIEI